MPVYLLDEPMEQVPGDGKTVDALTAEAGRSYGRIVVLLKKT